MRIGIDAMGGDDAPGAVVAGAIAALELLESDDRLVLVGQSEKVRAEMLASGNGVDARIDLVDAPGVISMDASPVEALRANPDSSIAVMARMQRKGELDAGISAGNTGACVAAAQMHLRRLSGVHRPGIAVVMPTFRGPVAVCDVGANVSCRPQHLHQYGIMAGLYLEAICGVSNPRVGLLSIGEEDAKGNELVRRTHQLLRDDPQVNFVGNVEGRDLFRGACDVMVCDGFVGNVVLKLLEGMIEGVVSAMMTELTERLRDHMQIDLFTKTVRDLVGRYDFNEYGGALLLGVGGISIIAHGATGARGFRNAIRAAKDFASHQVNQTITRLLSTPQAQRVAHD